MNNEMISTITEQTRNVFTPAQEFTRLIFSNTEKLVALQLASVQSYSELGFANLKELVEINDVDAFKDYMGKHMEFLKQVNERFVDDAKAVAELGNEFTAEVHKIGQESVKAASEKAA